MYLYPWSLGVKKSARRSAIEISWSSTKLDKACSDDRQGRKNWGADNWKLLKRRLTALQAAPTLGDMDGTPGNCHELRADRKGEFALYLWGSYRLVFEPVDEPLPTRPDGGIDRIRVTKIEIKEVVDYHGK